ncbi:DELTA-sagatoxin-Srs1a-like [Larimichthys crocea]|uniref:DELTA-sagatoxin-Srs1a-like n=1 Tax=Larimichthys crocea TaxID=215358 RepID=UPI000F6013AA|nr:DELTA-sagatoxin-Srs1a-like [Larimichthys crocea]XP_027140886.1 DELTA-sagatoxin-Srs1a-like [Larimichthys crocea]
MDLRHAIPAVAQLIPTHRQCSVEVTNKCSNYELCEPSVYMNSGFCAQSLPLTLEPSSSGNALFTKTPHGARGAVGVFTYDLLDKSTNESTEKIAVMFSVPYDFNLYSNWYAVGIFHKFTECNHDLYHKMYNNSDNSFVRGKAGGLCLKHKNNRVTVVASMSDSYQPVMKVEVKDD